MSLTNKIKWCDVDYKVENNWLNNKQKIDSAWSSISETYDTPLNFLFFSFRKLIMFCDLKKKNYLHVHYIFLHKKIILLKEKLVLTVGYNNLFFVSFNLGQSQG